MMSGSELPTGLMRDMVAMTGHAACDHSAPMNDASITVVDCRDAGALRKLQRLGISRSSVVIDIERYGETPSAFAHWCDVLLTTAREPPPAWINVSASDVERCVEDIESKVDACPVAASVLAQVLRTYAPLDFNSALILESHAYSTLLAGPEFKAWRSNRPIRNRVRGAHPIVAIERTGNDISVVLQQPERRNAFSAQMRDEIVEALLATEYGATRGKPVTEGKKEIFADCSDADAVVRCRCWIGNFGAKGRVQANDAAGIQSAGIIRAVPRDQQLGATAGERWIATARLGAE